ncbi:hypothetical protein [Microbispora amethystogenes]|uniref:Uncharacterized protein n=1 Tax=Microbispora amethystogenes TaxID=1427754 RepID=A0ABQ4FEW4_9ACTN|nr:hypothetical protein [Microbispora amethystogenes]GIH33273.1 hypothetical protein Mam01_34370 [Microbispora amethystogenes]
MSAAGVLAAADVFTVDNAMAMVESLRIDFGEPRSLRFDVM